MKMILEAAAAEFSAVLIVLTFCVGLISFVLWEYPWDWIPLDWALIRIVIALGILVAIVGFAEDAGK